MSALDQKYNNYRLYLINNFVAMSGTLTKEQEHELKSPKIFC